MDDWYDTIKTFVVCHGEIDKITFQSFYISDKQHRLKTHSGRAEVT